MQKFKLSSIFNQKFVLIFISILSIIVLGLAIRLAIKVVEKRLRSIHYQVSYNGSELIEAQNQTIQILLGSKLDTFASLLKIYEAKDEHGDIKLIRLGRDNDGGYIVPEKSLVSADVLFGYGIDNDISFEETFSNKYNKPSYGFDCGIESIKSTSKLFTFVNECISSDSSLYGMQKSSTKISSFTEQIKNLNLADKKIFIKMDIEGAEFDALQEVIKNPHNVTGIAFEMHLFKKHIDFDKGIKLLKDLENDFVLVHLHGLNCGSRFNSNYAKGGIPYQIEFTYINKALLTNYRVSKNQSHPTELDMPNDALKPEVKFTILEK